MMLLLKGLRTFFLANKSISYSLIATIFCLFISYMSLWLVTYNNDKQQQRFIHYHGEAVNKLMAKQLARAMASNDLIGMQSLLQSLSQQQNVVNAVIYNTDNTVIVQSGKINPRPLTSHYAFTTPIVLENSHLGSLTTTLNVNFQPRTWLFLLIIIAVTLPLLLLIHLITKRQTINLSKTTGPAPSAYSKTEIKAPPSLSDGFLLIHIHSANKVYEQLNAQARNNEFKALDSLLNQILTLYSGEKVALSQDIIILKFSREDTNKLLFDAICSAYLLLELVKKKRLFTELSAVLYNQQPHISLPIDIPLLSQLYQPDSIIINDLQDSHNLEGKVTFEASSEYSFQKVIGFSDNHQVLLSNQLSQLLKMCGA